MKKLIKNVLNLIIPVRFLKPKNQRLNRFIKINDAIGGKPFCLYMREDSFMEKVIFEKGLYGEWEKESLKIWAHLSKQSDVILDIGANTGIFSMLAQNNNSAAKVIAIEPVGVNFEVLSKNISRNKFPIIAEKVALSDKKGTAKMFMLKDRLNYMTSVNENRYAGAPHVKGNYEVVEIEVPIMPFSEIVSRHSLQKIDLVKIDVEGHEIAVLNSMLPWLQKYKPHILIEVIGDDNAIELNKIFGLMGYKFLSINEENISKQVNELWDNHHHNFLITNQETIQLLQQKNLAESK